MNYKKFEEKCNKTICIWGYGLYGKTYAYLSLKCAGAEIACYCDSNYRDNESYQQIPLIPKEKLFANTEIFVFVAMKSVEQQKKVIDELRSRGMDCAVFDQNSFSDLCESVIESNDKQILNKYADIVDDEKFLSFIYEFRTGEKLNLNKPKTFNEKIQWLKLNDRKEMYTNLVDKYEVKSVVSKIIGQKYIIPTIGIWDHVEKIDLDSMPAKFVLKCTHDSGSAVICSDKKSFCFSEAKEKLNKAINTNFYWLTREYPYKNVRPRIIAEAKLESNQGNNIKDYKVFCFNGEPRVIQVDYDRFSNHSRALYSTNWEYLGFSIQYPLQTVIESKPEKLDRILELARLLATGIPHVRIDFYLTDNKVYFGEMTFYHESGYGGFSDENWNVMMGDFIEYI